jgi:hypothetical protein
MGLCLCILDISPEFRKLSPEFRKYSNRHLVTICTRVPYIFQSSYRYNLRFPSFTTDSCHGCKKSSFPFIQLNLSSRQLKRASAFFCGFGGDGVIYERGQLRKSTRTSTGFQFHNDGRRCGEKERQVTCGLKCVSLATTAAPACGASTIPLLRS